MEFKLAKEIDTDTVHNIVCESIETSYPKCYPQEVTDFFINIIHTKENIKKDILNCEQYIVFDNEKIIGTGCIKDDYITRVYILSTEQGKGYGTKIMDFLEEKISKSYHKIHLDPSLLAVKFYEKRGYKTIKHNVCNLPNNVKLDHDVMEKII